nr:hypothetical protein CFP56_58798 [Quercus suber]
MSRFEKSTVAQSCLSQDDDTRLRLSPFPCRRLFFARPRRWMYQKIGQVPGSDRLAAEKTSRQSSSRTMKSVQLGSATQAVFPLKMSSCMISDQPTSSRQTNTAQRTHHGREKFLEKSSFRLHRGQWG